MEYLVLLVVLLVVIGLIFILIPFKNIYVFIAR